MMTLTEITIINLYGRVLMIILVAILVAVFVMNNKMNKMSNNEEIIKEEI